LIIDILAILTEGYLKDLNLKI